MKRPLRGWRLLLFARCEHASHADSDEWDGPIARDRWLAARLHRLVCGPCRHEHRRWEWLRRRLRSIPPEVRRDQADAAQAGLSAEAAERIRESLRAAQQEG